jgi:hypothetical protein
LQLITKVRLSSSSRAARLIAPRASGSSVAQEAPDARPARVLDLAGQQVPVEPGLVNRVDRGQAHRNGRELPEVRHQSRVRIRRQPAAGVGQLLPEPVELLLGQPALEERAGIDAGRRVPLEEHLVA